MTTDNSRADALTYEQVEALAAKHQFDMSTFDFTDSNSLVDLVNDAIGSFCPVEQHEAAPAEERQIERSRGYSEGYDDGLNAGRELLEDMRAKVERLEARLTAAQPEQPAADERDKG